ncbi:uncharacterized protein L201_001504 [Kwoniella dendrophila CBS 6074]|uniref:F-box domain-containing protein n=1 Tax=Kwoniella dendrophila CBS 6074 TaxID=1295534 RepID=A0AAX4JML5_9TREE
MSAITRYPSELVSLLLKHIDDTASPSTLCNLMRCSKGFYERFSKLLYKSLELDGYNVRAILKGIDRPKISLRRSKQSKGIDRHEKHINLDKSHLLRHVEYLSIEDEEAFSILAELLDPENTRIPTKGIQDVSCNNDVFSNLKYLRISPEITEWIFDRHRRNWDRYLYWRKYLKEERNYCDSPETNLTGMHESIDTLGHKLHPKHLCFTWTEDSWNTGEYGIPFIFSTWFHGFHEFQLDSLTWHECEKEGEVPDLDEYTKKFRLFSKDEVLEISGEEKVEYKSNEVEPCVCCSEK